mgnify:CR=1 FL=1
MKRTQKPVRNCHGCGLNLGETCGVYENPHDMWHNRECPGYKNEAMLAEYKERVARQQKDDHKEKRRAVMKERATADHRDGTRPPASLAGAS